MEYGWYVAMYFSYNFRDKEHLRNLSYIALELRLSHLHASAIHAYLRRNSDLNQSEPLACPGPLILPWETFEKGEHMHASLPGQKYSGHSPVSNRQVWFLPGSHLPQSVTGVPGVGSPDLLKSRLKFVFGTNSLSRRSAPRNLWRSPKL